MPDFSLAEAAAATGGRIVGNPALSLVGAHLDSRKVTSGSLFIAIPGEKVDGHDYVASAFEAGAGAALVTREGSLPPGKALLVVDDSAESLLALAGAIRRREGWTLVAITGSAGKTTTKEMTARVLAGFRPTAASPGNRNNTLGLPESVLNARPGLDVFVAECGMSFPGELTKLARALAPDVVVYTNVAPAHLQNFHSIDEIEAAKEELIVEAGIGAIVVANADDARTTAIASRHGGTRILYGIDSAGAAIRASEIERRDGGVRFLLTIPTGEAPVDLPMEGRHSISNFLAAAGAGFALGMTAAEIAAGASSIRPAPHRGERHRVAGGALLIDESYNSNPRSLAAAAEAFAEGESGGRKIGILGEMRELGSSSLELHRSAGRQIARYFDEIIAVGGGDARALIEGARDSGLPASSTRLLPTPESAAAAVLENLKPGDRILLKGSRGVELERALPAFGVSLVAEEA